MTEGVRLIIVGFGVVARSLAGSLEARGEEFRRTHGIDFHLVAAVDSKSAAVDRNGLGLRELLRRKEDTGRVGRRSLPVSEIIEDTEADVLVELTPGNPLDAEPGMTHLKSAIKASKHIVTANKMPLAHEYTSLVASAESRGVQLRYSACVGAGLPILDFGDACAVSEPVQKVEGVLNATSNFVLSRMESDGSSFPEALEEAKKLGYAESNPWLDVDGVDSAAKIVIIANHIMKKSLTLKDVAIVEGIRRISPTRVKALMEEGKKVRMVACVERRPEVRVLELPRDDPLSVVGACNVVRFHCKYSGERVVSGSAAGGVTTSSAVLRDLLRVGASIEGS